MSETFPSTLTGFFRSWRGTPLRDRTGLMRQMAAQLGAPKSAMDAQALGNCLYCRHTARCEDAFSSGHGAKAEKFCPNAADFRAAAAAAGRR